MIKLFSILFIGFSSFILGFYTRIKNVYIITKHRGLISEIICICFSEKSAIKMAKKIKNNYILSLPSGIESAFTIYITKYRTLIYLNREKKLNKKFLEEVTEI